MTKILLTPPAVLASNYARAGNHAGMRVLRVMLLNARAEYGAARREYAAVRAGATYTSRGAAMQRCKTSKLFLRRAAEDVALALRLSRV